MVRIDTASFELGIAMVELKNAYYFDDLAAFIEDKPNENGKMYFGEVKPLIDKYGYATVKEAFRKIRTKKAKTEVKTNE